MMLPDDEFVQMPPNPLAAYYRVPGLHIRLPTNGTFMPKNSIVFNMAGEVEILPLTAADEMLMKSPDALMSGQALENMIRSCVPAIKYPRLVSSPDLDVLLLAVRAASYGMHMGINPVCPKCEHENSFSCNLQPFFMNIPEIKNEYPIELTTGLTVYVRPYNLENTTKISLLAFNETKMIQNLNDDELRTQETNKSLKKMFDMELLTAADCILKIKTPAAMVTDKAAILEFVQNIQSSWVKLITDQIKELNSMGIDKKVEIRCEACENVWNSDIEFDPSTFFEAGS